MEFPGSHKKVVGAIYNHPFGTIYHLYIAFWGVICYLGWWFGILRVPLSNNSFHKGILGIQTTNPNQQLTICRDIGEKKKHRNPRLQQISKTSPKLELSPSHLGI